MNDKKFRPKYRGTPPHGYFALKPGTIVRLRTCFGGYALPPGLNEGDDVRVTKPVCLGALHH